jgi:hypothetical protein
MIFIRNGKGIEGEWEGYWDIGHGEEAELVDRQCG